MGVKETHLNTKLKNTCTVSAGSWGSEWQCEAGLCQGPGAAGVAYVTQGHEDCVGSGVSVTFWRGLCMLKHALEH